jgi:hypothetical protein
MNLDCPGFKLCQHLCPAGRYVIFWEMAKPTWFSDYARRTPGTWANWWTIHGGGIWSCLRPLIKLMIGRWLNFRSKIDGKFHGRLFLPLIEQVTAVPSVPKVFHVGQKDSSLYRTYAWYGWTDGMLSKLAGNSWYQSILCTKLIIRATLIDGRSILRRYTILRLRYSKVLKAVGSKLEVPSLLEHHKRSPHSMQYTPYRCVFCAESRCPSSGKFTVFLKF